MILCVWHVPKCPKLKTLEFDLFDVWNRYLIKGMGPVSSYWTMLSTVTLRHNKTTRLEGIRPCLETRREGTGIHPSFLS